MFKRIAILCMGMVLTSALLAGCSNADNSAEEKNTSSPTGTTAQEFLEGKGKDQLQRMKDEASEAFMPLLGAGGSVDVTVNGYEITYTMQYDEETLTDMAREALDENIESMRAIFIATANEAKKAGKLSDIIYVTVTYLDSTGAEITSHTFQSDEI